MLPDSHLNESITEKTQPEQSGVGAEKDAGKDAEKIIRLERENKLLKEYIRWILTKKNIGRSPSN